MSVISLAFYEYYIIDLIKDILLLIRLVKTELLVLLELKTIYGLFLVKFLLV